jgi:YbgC/YbaW family acyl-CoA thioester hydrolase
MIKKEDIQSNLNSFKHCYKGRVEFSHVDSFDVVHNLQYLYFLEWARTDYIISLAKEYNSEFYKEKLPIMTVSHIINYFDSLKFQDRFEVLTKINRLGDSSFTFESIIINENRELIIHCLTTFVNVNFATRKSESIPADIRKLIQDFEGL